jgi:catechol 2,3-dioxygenase-like lactoylglutathione lyase family enzyme
VGILNSRILLRPSDLDRSRRFYRDVLGLAIYREFDHVPRLRSERHASGAP